MRFRTRSSLSIPFALILATAPVAAQSLLADVNTVPATDPSSIVTGVAAVDGARVFFAASDRRHGEEPWVSDGTPAGTRLVADVVPGSGGSTPRQMVAFAGGVVFTVGPLRALWHTDGTAVGTRLLTSATLGLEDPVVSASRLFFAANGAGSGQELWSSDGSSAGTALVKDIRPGTGWSEPRRMVAWQNEVLFLANDGSGTRVWRSDGTSPGTVELAPNAPYGTPHELVATGNAVWFLTIGASGGELWRSDGTAAGTVPVRAGLSTAPYPASLTAFGNLVLFTADDKIIGVEPWRSDGTPAGTFPLGDLYPGNAFPPAGSPRSFAASGNRAWFSLDDGVHGHEPWTTDGTTAGTRLLADIRPGPNGSLPSQMRVIGADLHFVADDGVHGTEPWTSDGTSGGTRLLRDVNPFGTSYPSGMLGFGGTLFFIANDGTHGSEPWISDGTTGGTLLLLNVASGVASSVPDHFSRFGRRFVFVADDGVHGREPWISDGTTAGTSLLKDVASGPAQSHAREFVEWRGRLWFAPYDANGDSEPWISDGTTAGTVRFADLVPGVTGSRPHSFTPLRDRMVFAAGPLSSGQELWVTDGSPSGTVMIDLDPNTAASPNWIRRAGDRAFFVASDSAHGTELRITDGTSAGTRLVADLVPGPGGAQIANVTAVGERVFFQAAVQFNPLPVDIELWTSDGTASGTRRVADIAPGPASSYPRSLVSWRDRVWFFVTTGLFTTELWTSDGTTLGTLPVAGALPPTTDLVVAGDLLFFGAGAELWRSDGTAAGTFPIAFSGATVTAVSEVAPVGNGTRVAFAAVSTGSGREVWISDGTTAGTFPLAEIWPGPDGAAPADFATVGPLLVFAADDGVRGVEPHVLALASIGASLAQPFGAPCPGSGGDPGIGAIASPSASVPGFALTLDGAHPSAPAVCAFGTDVAPGAELMACAPAITGTTVVVVMGTDPAGRATLQVPVPADPGLVGAHLYAQFVVVDPLGGFLSVLAFSDLIDLLVGE